MEEIITVLMLGILCLLVGCISGDYREKAFPPSNEEYRVVKIEDTLSLSDIHPEHACWDEAQILSDFSFPWRTDIPSATYFRAWHNEVHLFFHFEVMDSDIVAINREGTAQDVIYSDRVELFFAVDDSLKRYYALEMDPKGRVYDYVAHFYREFDLDWNMESLQVKSQLTTQGYEVWGAISTKELEQLQLLRAGNWMRVGVYRAEFSHRPEDEIEQAWISWIDPKTPIPDFHVPASFGKFILE